jgi:hypothetical protein
MSWGGGRSGKSLYGTALLKLITPSPELMSRQSTYPKNMSKNHIFFDIFFILKHKHLNFMMLQNSEIASYEASLPIVELSSLGLVSCAQITKR